METRCPQCHTIFRIGMEQLSMAKGQVRCGQCNHVFNAADEIITGGSASQSSEALLDTVNIEVPEVHAKDIMIDMPDLDVPGSSADNIEVEDTTEETINAETVSEASEPTSNKDNNQAETHKTAKDGYDVTVLYPELEVPPVIHAPISTKSTLTWSLLIISLLVLLFLQLAYFKRDTLARNEKLHPLLESMCDVMGCEIIGHRAPSLVHLESHKVLSHPKESDALRVEAVIINQATFTQAYPVLRLRFLDLDGRLLASRDFLPQHYLPTDVNRRAGMTPGEPVNTVLDIIDPGKKAISYEFDFL